MYIDYFVEDNYHRIKTIYQWHSSRKELSWMAGRKKSRRDAGQPQVHEEDEEQCTGPADGIVKEIVPNIILPMDGEFD